MWEEKPVEGPLTTGLSLESTTPPCIPTTTPDGAKTGLLGACPAAFGLATLLPETHLCGLRPNPALPYVAPVGIPFGGTTTTVGALAGACVTVTAACVPLWTARTAAPPTCDMEWTGGGWAIGTLVIVCAETAACTPVPAAAAAEFAAAVAFATAALPPTVTQPRAPDAPKGDGPVLGIKPFLPTPKAPLTDAACVLLTPATVPQLCTGTPSAPPVPLATAPPVPDEHV
mmetsp:Transcript_30010/g.75993  ORF Transcript_30010/g.75993 Transcript_30010/m.75993 type:complete len:229 (-) Transcript_30010:184-870(-)